MDLTPFVGKVTPAELDGLISEQARLRNPANQNETSPRGAIGTAIERAVKMDRGLANALDASKNAPDYKRTAYVNVATDMEAYLRSVTGGKRAPTDAEMDTALNRATMKVIVKGGGFFGLTDVEKPRYALKGGEAYTADVPDDVRQRIISAYGKANPGMSPNDILITQIYVQNKGKPGYWQ